MAEIEKDINLLEETPVGSEDINEEVNVVFLEKYHLH